MLEVVIFYVLITGSVPDGFEKYPRDMVVLSGTSVTQECKLIQTTNYLVRIFIQFNNRTSRLLTSKDNGEGHYEVTNIGKTVIVKILNVSKETEGGYSCTGLHYFGETDVEGPISWVRLAGKFPLHSTLFVKYV